jgi:hypothetical protein
MSTGASKPATYGRFKTSQGLSVQVPVLAPMANTVSSAYHLALTASLLLSRHRSLPVLARPW